MDSDSLAYTYQYDKYSCVVGFYYAHVLFAYIIGISGLLCMITRFIPKLKWTHYWLGRVYILAMLWSTATSLLIHNTGLPLGVLISFLWVLGGLTLGWIAINIHQAHITHKALDYMLQSPKSHTPNDLPSVKNMITQQKSFYERLFSYKTFHGIAMFTSWINIVGRIFVTPLTGNFECATKTYYKQPNATSPLIPVPLHDPNYTRLPWANREASWGAILLFSPIFISFALSAGYSWYISPKDPKIIPNTDREA